MIKLVLLINFTCCTFMTGLIWLVQLVHYPTFTYVPEKDFISFSHFHSKTITYIVLPVMMIELATSGYLYWLNDSLSYLTLLILNIGLFASTFFLSVPYHNALATGKSDELIKKLVVTNWPRTLMWSFRLFMIFFLLVKSL